MLDRRSLLLSVLALPLPLAAAVAQPWWNENNQRAKWEHYQEVERRRRMRRHEAWDERHEHQKWERRRREEAQLEWEREHGPYRR